MPTRNLTGSIKPGCGWVTPNWDRLVLAHRPDLPDIAEYRPGTLNVVLAEPWSPPGDEQHRRVSHRRGMDLGCDPALGADFLANGNYIHPTVRVVALDGVGAEGRLYFPGVERNRWEHDDSVWATIAPVGRIEVLSRVYLREVLGIDPEDEIEVVVQLVEE